MRRLLFMIALGLALPAHAQVIAVTHARILSVGRAGTIESGTLIVEDGRIVYVGPDKAPPTDATVIDGTGKVLTPGLVEADTPLGLSDLIDLEGMDSRQTASADVTVSYDVRHGIDPAAPTIVEARAQGVTRAIVTPQVGQRPAGAGSVFAGRAAAIELGSGTNLLVKSDVAVVMDAGEAGAVEAGGGRGAAIVKLEALLAEARLYSQKKPAYDEGRLRILTLSDQDLRALVPIVEGKVPLLVRVSRAADIRTLLALARTQKVRIILSGAEEAWLVADEIAAAQVPVVLDFEINQPDRFETLNATYDNAAYLAKAGVLFAYKPAMARIDWLIRSPRFIAGRSVAHGVSYDAALAAITVNPARIFGLDGLFGSLEPGKDADFVIWDSDPFEYSTAVTAVYVKGIRQSLVTRADRLRERYVPGTTGAAPR